MAVASVAAVSVVLDSAAAAFEAVTAWAAASASEATASAVAVWPVVALVDALASAAAGFVGQA